MVQLNFKQYLQYTYLHHDLRQSNLFWTTNGFVKFPQLRSRQSPKQPKCPKQLFYLTNAPIAFPVYSYSIRSMLYFGPL